MYLVCRSAYEILLTLKIYVLYSGLLLFNKLARKPPALMFGCQSSSHLPPKIIACDFGWGSVLSSRLPHTYRKEEKMARKVTSKRVASKASRVLRRSASSKVKSVAASALSQREKHRR